MDKKTLLALVEVGIKEGVVTSRELSALAEQHGASKSTSDSHDASRNVINALYAIGAIVVIIGAAILVGQHWEEIGFLGRLLVTLGISLVAYVSGFLFKEAHQRVVSQVFFTISAALAPVGIFAVLDEGGTMFTAQIQIYAALGLALVYGTALYLRRLNILSIILIAFLTWAYYAFLVFVLPLSPDAAEIYKWATLIAGLAYISIGYGYPLLVSGDEHVEKERKGVRSILYLVGSLATLISVSLFEGVGEIVALAAIFALFYASVFLKSRAMLVLSALFLIGNIVKLTAEYFVDSIGWPLSLILVGFLVIGIGYATFRINKKYIAR